MKLIIKNKWKDKKIRRGVIINSLVQPILPTCKKSKFNHKNFYMRSLRCRPKFRYLDHAILKNILVWGSYNVLLANLG